MLLSPVNAGADHLKALARVSRRLRDRGFTAKLRGAGSADAIYALLAGNEARDAAA
jgi:PTS system nitrogen regulatory IIA component